MKWKVWWIEPMKDVWRMGVDILEGAALDVFDSEPIRPDSPLLTPEIAERLLLSPHVSGLTREMEEGLTLAQVDCCLKALRGEAPRSTLNPEAIPRWRQRFQ